MSEKERPLPKPSTRAFGRKNIFEQEEGQASLLSDRMAQAAVEGKLDEFLKNEMPDNEYARNLANMMMGMTGIMPGSIPGMAEPAGGTEEQQEPAQQESAQQGTNEPGTEVPEDVRSAIMGGDLESLMGLLRREHQKRNPGAAVEQGEASPSAAPNQPSVDKETIDALVRIASENSLTVDWMILRAIKVYVQEYQKTGKL